MNNQTCENMFRATLICVDSYDHKILKGRIMSPYYQDCVLFESTIEFLANASRELDTIQNELAPVIFQHTRFQKYRRKGIIDIYRIHKRRLTRDLLSPCAFQTKFKLAGLDILAGEGEG